MLTKQEQEILGNAPSDATEYKIVGDATLYGCNMHGDSLADLRKKQGKTVVDAVNEFKAEIPKLYVSDSVNATNNYFVTFVDGQLGVDDVASNDVICDKEEFNQCVNNMSENSGELDYQTYLTEKTPLEPTKPRTKVEYVPMTTIHPYKIFKAMEDDGDVYIVCEGGEYEGMSGCVINLANAIGDETTIYRKVETEIKTEKRWIIYNSRGEFCSEHDHEYKPFDKSLQVIEIEVEV